MSYYIYVDLDVKNKIIYCTLHTYHTVSTKNTHTFKFNYTLKLTQHMPSFTTTYSPVKAYHLKHIVPLIRTTAVSHNHHNHLRTSFAALFAPAETAQFGREQAQTECTERLVC
jgi:hypothetical protein